MMLSDTYADASAATMESAQTGQVGKSLPRGSELCAAVNTTSATAGIGTGSVTVTVSSSHLDAQTSAQVTSGKVTSITLEVIQPHVVCEGNSTLRLTPELTATSSGPD